MLHFRILRDGSSGGGSGSAGQGGQPNDDWKTKYDALKLEHDTLVGTHNATVAELTQSKSATEEATKRFTGLQQVYQKDKDALQALQGEHGKLTTQYQTAFAEAETIKGSLAERQAAFDRLQAEHATATSDLTRKNLIMSQFPELASFEAKGLLPKPMGDQKLEDLLGNFQASIAAISDKAKANFAAGGSGDPGGLRNLGGGGGQTAATAAALQAKMNDASLHGDQAGYDAAYTELMKINNNLPVNTDPH